VKEETIRQLYKKLEGIVRIEVESNEEVWLGREFQAVLTYARWENFNKIIEKAKTACTNSGHHTQDHFRDVTKMVGVGSGANREIRDVMLTRYGCYLVAQNGDPSKKPVAFAQTYFAMQTRTLELIQQRIEDSERIKARKKLTISEKELSETIDQRVGDLRSFARIRSHGDEALFGGHTTRDMKKQLGTPPKRPLADFLPTITIKAKDFANEITNFNVKKEDLGTEGEITFEHVKNNKGVRKLLLDRNIIPESLPPDKDVKKVERQLEGEKKQIAPK